MLLEYEAPACERTSAAAAAPPTERDNVVEALHAVEEDAQDAM
jgi:hypothetical protein